MTERKSILVLGLLPGQAHRVERDCEPFNVRLRFVEGKHNGGLRGAGGADHCVVMVKFVDHGHSGKALGAFPRDRVHFNKGGMKELVATIQGIADGSKTHGARHPMHAC